MLLALPGCAPSVRIDGKPVVELGSARAAAPPALTAECARPADIAEAPLSAGAVERLWADDRAALTTCRSRHAAVIDFYVRRDAGLAGAAMK